MSGRRISNPGWLARGIAVAICSLASVGVGLALVHSTAAASTVFTGDAARLNSVISDSAAAREPLRVTNRGALRFVVQPRLVGRDLFFVVRVAPYHTADRNRSTKADLLRGSVDVSRRGVTISTVGLDPKTRAKQLIFATKLKMRVVRRAGRIEYRIRLPLAVARSLAATSVRNRTTRVRVVVEHAIDTDPSLPRHQTIKLVQSSLKPLPTARSRAATDRLHPEPRAKNVTAFAFLYNSTPFTLQVSVQPTQCVGDAPQWSGTMLPGQALQESIQILYSGNANGLSVWQNLSQSAVSALQPAAVSAGQNAINMGAASFTPEGAISNGVVFEADFLVDFIGNFFKNSCGKTPATWVISAVATDLPLPLWQGFNDGDVAQWAVDSDGNPFQSGPVQTPAQLVSTLGAQTSVQWNWNGGNIVADGAGASYFSGGLLQTTISQGVYGGNESTFNTIFSYQNNAQNTYGPIQTSNITMTASPGIDPNEGTPAVNLTCNTGNWSLVSPWGSYFYDLSIPPNSSASGNLVTSFYYNGVDGSGNSLTGQPIPGINSDQSGYAGNSQTQVWVTQSTIQGIIQSNGGGTIASWGCSVQAQTQVPSFLQPSGWPSPSNTSNFGWYSEPLNAIAPNP